MAGSLADDLGKVFTTVSLNAVGVFSVKVLGFLSAILLTNWLPPSEYGIYAYITTVVSVVAAISRFGSRESMMNFLPQYDDQQRDGLFAVVLSTVVLGNLLLGAVLYAAAPFVATVTNNGENFVTVLRLFTVVLFVDSVIKPVTGSFFGLELPKYGIFVDKLFRPFARLAVIAVAVFVGYDLVGISVLLIFVAVATLLLAAWFLAVKTDLRPNLSRAASVTRGYFDYGGTITVRSIGMTLFTKTDIILLGVLATNTDVAVYKIAWMLAIVVDLPLNGVGQVFPSIVSRYHDAGDDERIEELLRTVTKWTAALSLFIFLGAVVFRAELLQLFGESYSRLGGVVLVIVALPQLLSNLVGPAGHILLMTGYQRLQTVQTWSFGLLNVVLNLWLISRFGIVGAAMSMALTMGTNQLLHAVEVWYLEGYVSVSRRLLRAPVLLVPVGLVMELLRTTLGGLTGLFLGGTVGTVLFAVLAYVFVVDERDVEAVRLVS